MTYEINYAELPEGPEKTGKAVQDIINYLGMTEFVRISDCLRLSHSKGEFAKHDDRELRFALMMIGVQGYAVQAWFNLLFGELPKPE